MKTPKLNPVLGVKYDSLGNPIYYVRKEPIRDNEVLYDRHGKAAAIKTKGRILAILDGEE